MSRYSAKRQVVIFLPSKALFIIMKVIDEGTDSERIVARVRIEGSFKGIMFVYEDPEGYEGSQYWWVKDNLNPSTYWWSDGNYACDCNRWRFLPDWMKHDGNCGHTIKIDRILPLEGDNLPILELNESE